MYFSDNWSFVVEIEDETNTSLGVVPVDLQEEDDRGDIEPCRDINTGELFCTLGVEADEDGSRTCKIINVWEYRENEPFNSKFSMFHPIDMEAFVRRLLDAEVAFGDMGEDENQRLRKSYGV